MYVSSLLVISLNAVFQYNSVAKIDVLGKRTGFNHKKNLGAKPRNVIAQGEAKRNPVKKRHQVRKPCKGGT